MCGLARLVRHAPAPQHPVWMRIALVICAWTPWSSHTLISAEPAPPLQWLRQFGSAGPAFDQAQAVDSDGSLYVAGHTDGTFPGEAAAGGFDAFVRKHDPDGALLWTRQFGTSATELVFCVAADS